MSSNRPSTQVEVFDTQLRQRSVTSVGSSLSAIGNRRQADRIGTAQTNHETTRNNVFTSHQIQAHFAQFIRHLETTYENLSDEIKEAFDLPKLFEDFKSLDWKSKCVIILTLVAVMGLVGWGTWELACWLYPRILQFLESDAGRAVVGHLETGLGFLRSAGVIEMFTNALSGAVSTVINGQTGQNQVDISEVDPADLNSTSTQIEEIASSQLPQEQIYEFIASYAAWMDQFISN